MNKKLLERIQDLSGLMLEHNTFIWRGQRSWIGIVNLLDGVIEETHTYYEAKRNDFHHSYYFSPEALEKLKNKNEYSTFLVDEKGHISTGYGDKLPSNIEERIRKQIRII